MAETRFRYPEGLPDSEKMDPRALKAARAFFPLLFEYGRLGEIVSPRFVGHEGAGQPKVYGVEGLQTYRKSLGTPAGDPVLKHVELIGVPMSLSPEIPGQNGRRFSTSFILDHVFTLPPDLPQFDTHVMLWESVDTEPDPEDPERHLVVARVWDPVDPAALRGGSTQHDFVAQQVNAFVNGKPLPLAPLAYTYNAMFSDLPYRAQVMPS
jgi:hypothetical protein